MDDKMKTTMSIVGFAAFICVVGLVALLLLNDKDPSVVLNALPGIAASLGALLVSGIVSQKVDRVQGQTNGTLTAMRAENAALLADKISLLTIVSPEQAAAANTLNNTPKHSEE